MYRWKNRSIRAREKSTLMKLKLYPTKSFNYFIVKFNLSIQHLVTFSKFIQE